MNLSETTRKASFVAIVQARQGSTRLPSKVLLPLGEVTVLEFLLDRLKKSKYLDALIVATGPKQGNAGIVRLCERLEVKVFSGSENDVLDRFWTASQLVDASHIVRITADCPLFDYRLLDEAIEQLKPETDYLGMLSETFPDGLDLEIIKLTALETAWNEARLPSEREHVTPFIRNNPQRFCLQDYVSKLGDSGELRWTLDEEADYQLISKIVGIFEAKGLTDFDYSDILTMTQEMPELSQINEHINRNEGLFASQEAVSSKKGCT